MTAEGRLLTVIEPIPKFVEAVGDKIFCSSEIEPGINCSIGPVS
jgi:hypothetical protein